MSRGLLLLAASILALQLCFHSFLTTIPLSMAAVGVPNGLIGVMIGAGALVQIPTAVLAGHAMPRVGAPRALLAGGVIYLIGAGILALPAVAVVAMVASRVLLGIGIVMVLAAAYTIVPGIVSATRVGSGLAVMGVADNIAFALAPLASTFVYSIAGLRGAALAAMACALAGCGLAVWIVRSAPGETKLRYHDMMGYVFRIERPWLPVLAVILLTTLYFGATLAFLSPRAELVGLNAGLFFSANGLAILVLKLPAGYLADLCSWRPLAAVGIVMTALAVAALIQIPTAAILASAGLLSGAGAAFASTALLTTLARRSNPVSRGSANAAAGMAQSTAIASGGLIGAPLVTIGGFGLAMVAALVGLAAAFLVVLRDRWQVTLLPGDRQAGRPRDEEVLE